MHGAAVRRAVKVVLLVLMALYSVAHVQTSVAHETQPAVVEIEVASNGALKIKARLNLEAFLADIGADHADTDDAPTAALYDALRQLAIHRPRASPVFHLKASPRLARRRWFGRRLAGLA